MRNGNVRQTSRGLRLFGFALLIGAALVGGAIGALQILSRASDSEEAATLTSQPNLSSMGTWNGQERITVLLLGESRRPGGERAVETVMLLGLDPTSRKARLFSIPPEVYVPLPGRRPGFLSSAYVGGDVDYFRQAMEFNFGIPIPYYATVTAEAMIALVDLAGGATVYNNREMNATLDGEAFALGVGWHVLNGKQALQYARAPSTTDPFAQIFERTQRQQQLMLAMHSNLLTTDAAAKLLPQLPQILTALQGNIKTNLSADEIARLVLAAKEVREGDLSTLALDAAATQVWDASDGVKVLVPNRAAVRELREQFLNMSTADASAAQRVSTETGIVRIQNGTQRRGLAAATRDYLQSRGVTVAEIGDAPQAYARSVIVDYRNRPRFAQRLAAELNLPVTSISVSPDAAQPVDALIILGDDYNVPQP